MLFLHDVVVCMLLLHDIMCMLLHDVVCMLLLRIVACCCCTFLVVLVVVTLLFLVGPRGICERIGVRHEARKSEAERLVRGPCCCCF